MHYTGRPPRLNNRGVTLVEIVFAMCVLLMCAFLFVAAFPVATRSRTKVDNRSTAVALAERQLEAARDAGYSVLLSAPGLFERGVIDSAGATSPYPCSNVTLNSDSSVSSSLEDGSATMAVVREAGFDELLRIRVNVRWTEEGEQREINVNTLLTQL